MFTYFERPLGYIGYGGSGKQVRDLLHVDDLIDLIEEQLLDPDRWAGSVVNVGGGRGGSLSLLETTEICRELTGNGIDVRATSETRLGDLRIYVSDCRRLFGMTDWRPRRPPRQVLEDVHAWMRDHETTLLTALVS